MPWPENTPLDVYTVTFGAFDTDAQKLIAYVSVTHVSEHPHVIRLCDINGATKLAIEEFRNSYTSSARNVRLDYVSHAYMGRMPYEQLYFNTQHLGVV